MKLKKRKFSLKFKRGSKVSHVILEILGITWVKFLLLNLSIFIVQLTYLSLRFSYINSNVPFFYTKPWGDYQLAPKAYLYLIPLIGITLHLVSVLFYQMTKKYYWPLLDRVFLSITSIVNLVLMVSLIRIIFIASSPFEPLFNTHIIQLVPPFLFALFITITLAPKFITYFKEHNIVTNPHIHSHPSMILSKPSARGGGFIFTLFLIATSALFIGFSKEMNAIYIGTALLALLGLMDDYQNTNPKSNLRFLENPIIRLSSMFIIVLIPIQMGIRINSVGNLFGEIINFSKYTIMINGMQVHWLAILVTALWIVWLLNVLSWSNGVDGQYGGIVGIALIVIALLALRFDPIKEIHLNTAKIAVIGAGAAIGLNYYNWHPSKIMWGFGAVSAGLLISITSILVAGKVAASTMIVLLPFLDATVIIIRRIAQKKNPLKGDRGHLHHLLMDKGWGVRRISVFYWITTGLMGSIVLFTAEKATALLFLTVAGLVAFFILLLNFTANNKLQNLIKRSTKVLNK